VAACSRSAERTTGDASARADAELVIKVYVDDQGQIFVNGKQTTLPGLKEELQRAATRGATVAYSRANPSGDPPPHAMDVMQSIVEAGLPVRLLEGPE
jgi:biopolymer transport protein ExbD